MKKSLSFILAFALCFGCFCFTAGADVNEDGYIKIYTIEDLYNVRLDLTANYILMNDIDLTEATAKGGDWDFMGNGWNPIGSNDIYSNGAFSGTFDGNDHSIIGMRIDGATMPSNVGIKYVGLFANVTGSIHDLIFENAIINWPQAGTSYIGSIAGNNSGSINNISANVIITLNKGTGNIAGGIVGRSQGIVSRCSTAGSVKYSYSYSSGSTHTSGVGGIVGYATGGTISECYNTATLEQRNTSSGAEGFIGGICGYAYYYSPWNGSTPVTIKDCYNIGDVSSSNTYYIAGILGENGGSTSSKHTITNCYNIGKCLTSSGIANSGAYGIVDDISRPAVTVDNCYYLHETGKSNTGSTSLTESQMKLQGMYTGFDFENVWTINPYAVYPYPQLKDNVQDLREMASLVSIIALPVKTQCVIGKELDLAGGMVRVVYTSGKEEVLNISADMISSFDNSILGEQTVTVTVNGASDTFTVTVVDTPENRGVNEVRLLTKPSVTTFVVGSAFDFSGATVAVSYADGAYETVDVTEDMTSGGNINHIGKQTITVTFGDKSASFEVEVVGISFENIKLATTPTKLTYLEGEELDLSGMVITAVMNNGTESSINSGYTVSGYSSTPGVHTVSVTYLEKTVSFEVTVTEKEIVSLKLEALPEKLEYISGEEFDRNGVNLTATYNNGDVEKVTDFTVSGFDDVPGIKTVVLSFEGKSVSFPVTVTSKVITGFNLVSAPSKLNYIEGEEFDSTGLVAEVTYNNGTRELVEDYEIIGFTSTPGVHTVAVTYSGFVQNFVITVSEKVLDDVIVTPPTKLNYYIGEEFDATGLTVTACYNNGVRQGVDGYTISGFDSKTAGIKTVTVSYGGFTRSFALSVTKKTPVQSNGSVKVDSVKGRLGETVEVDVALTQNPGLAGFCHTISFDVSAVKFVSAKLKGAFANGTIVVNEENKASGEISIVWFQAENVTEAGVAYTLSFEILETAEDGVSEISVSFDLNDNGNAEGQDVEFGTVNGSVEVLSYWLGDLDGNREFTMADLLQLAQYVSGMDITLSDNQLLSADVNEDTFIDIHDVTLLSQWLLNADI